MTKTSLCINAHTIFSMPMLIRALRRRADDLETSDARQCKQLRKRSLRLAKRAAWVMMFFPVSRPLALRELSLIYRDVGKIKKAYNCAKKSCETAKSQSAAYELAQSSLLQAQLAKQLDMPDADQQLQLAEAEMGKFQAMIDAAVAQTIN